jgi:hypothetical protein
LDPQRRIRGIYDAAQPDEIDRLLTDIRLLFAETHDR